MLYPTEAIILIIFLCLTMLSQKAQPYIYFGGHDISDEQYPAGGKINSPHPPFYFYHEYPEDHRRYDGRSYHCRGINDPNCFGGIRNKIRWEDVDPTCAVECSHYWACLIRPLRECLNPEGCHCSLIARWLRPYIREFSNNPN